MEIFYLFAVISFMISFMTPFVLIVPFVSIDIINSRPTVLIWQGEYNMTTTYEQTVFSLGKSLESFEESINSCDIHRMLDKNVEFVETLKNANRTFEMLPQKIKSTEMGTHHKSKELVQKYFHAKGKIDQACSCMSVSHRS